MLGIIDWGIGGVSVYKEVRNQLGDDLPVMYFSDTGATPYGKMSRHDLASRLDTVIEFMKSRGMTHLVIGCNAASTAIPDLAEHGIKIEGMIKTAVEVAAKVKPTRLGLIGGRRTVVSGVYRKTLAKRGIALEQRIAQPLSALIEKGDLSSGELKANARAILGPIKNCSHIMLACTHYPAIAETLSEFVSADTKFIDPAPMLVKKISKWKIGREKESIFMTTGDASQMKRSAKLAFGIDLSAVKKVKV